MARKEEVFEAAAVELQAEIEEEKVAVDYSTMSMEELLEAIGTAYKDKNMKLMATLSKLYTKKEAEAEKTKKDALLQELVATTLTVKSRINALVEEMLSEGLLDGAEGVWYARDFGEIENPGINPSCRLVKGSRKAGTESGGGSGKSSYVANPAKSADLLAQVGNHVYFKDNTGVTIDKQLQTMPAGMTFKEAYDFSTNGGWRNRVRMALLKEAGII